ncbi:unnamed protein product [Amoebophrya sp. A25]|nr:unnamed protein product [Amoebophrya sp. A25]|eukprot:GSA25T00007575001.1
MHSFINDNKDRGSRNIKDSGVCLTDNKEVHRQIQDTKHYR